jgi:hypothetical protein
LAIFSGEQSLKLHEVPLRIAIIICYVALIANIGAAWISLREKLTPVDSLQKQAVVGYQWPRRSGVGELMLFAIATIERNFAADFAAHCKMDNH